MGTAEAALLHMLVQEICFHIHSTKEKSYYHNALINIFSIQLVIFHIKVTNIFKINEWTIYLNVLNYFKAICFLSSILQKYYNQLHYLKHSTFSMSIYFK